MDQSRETSCELILGLIEAKMVTYRNRKFVDTCMYVLVHVYIYLSGHLREPISYIPVTMNTFTTEFLVSNIILKF